MDEPPFLEPDQLLAEATQETKDAPDDRQIPAKLREKWCAAHLANCLMSEDPRRSVKVRVLSKEADEADFELLVDARLIRFQHKEALNPAINPGDEFKARARDPLHGTPYRPRRGMLEGPKWIHDAVQAAAAKCYSTRPHLLIYANFDAEDLQINKVLELCKPFRNNFPSLWVLQNHRAIQIWQSEQTKGLLPSWVYFNSQ